VPLAGAEDFPPCFAEQNATAFAGAEDFPPCFAEQNVCYATFA